MTTGVPPTLLVATSNRGKYDEFVQLLPEGIVYLSPRDVAMALPPEDGVSFAEIATQKALAAANMTGLLTLADDSGLEVAALGGAPGVHSARFAGDPTDDERNRQALLAALRNVPPAERVARFICSLVLARPGTIVASSDGTCEGMISCASRGSFGFGYDPVFELPDGRTMAELSAAEKNQISHRARAIRQILPTLLQELGSRSTTGDGLR